jgi:hypothetical protein
MTIVQQFVYVWGFADCWVRGGWWLKNWGTLFYHPHPSRNEFPRQGEEQGFRTKLLNCDYLCIRSGKIELNLHKLVLIGEKKYCKKLQNVYNEVQKWGKVGQSGENFLQSVKFRNCCGVLDQTLEVTFRVASQ